MTLFLSIVVGVLFAVSVYLMLGRELKEVCMGVFLLTHAAPELAPHPLLIGHRDRNHAHVRQHFGHSRIDRHVPGR